MAPRIIFSHGNSFPANTYKVMLDSLRQRGFEVDAIEKFGHDPRYPVTNNWPHLVQQLADFVRDKQDQYALAAQQSMDRFVPRDDSSTATASAARQSIDPFVTRDDNTPVTASAARQSMDRFVPRDDDPPVTASAAQQSIDPFVPRVDNTPVTASEARQSIDRFVPRDDDSPVTASAARQSIDPFVTRDDNTPVTASAARQSIDRFVPRDDSPGASSEPAFLVGHSLGGILSLMCAAQHPELVRGVLLIDSPVLGGWRATTLGLAKRTALVGALSPGRISQKRRNTWPSQQAALESFQDKKSFARWDPQVLRDYIEYGTHEENGQRVLSFDREVETAIYNSLPHKLDSLLKRKPLKCPVAFIGGIHSAEMRQAGTDLTHKVVKGRIMMVDGSHLFPMEKPLATAAAIEASLRNLGA